MLITKELEGQTLNESVKAARRGFRFLTVVLLASLLLLVAACEEEETPTPTSISTQETPEDEETLESPEPTAVPATEVATPPRPAEELTPEPAPLRISGGTTLEEQVLAEILNQLLQQSGEAPGIDWVLRAQRPDLNTVDIYWDHVGTALRRDYDERDLPVELHPFNLLRERSDEIDGDDWYWLPPARYNSRTVVLVSREFRDDNQLHSIIALADYLAESSERLELCAPSWFTNSSRPDNLRSFRRLYGIAEDSFRVRPDDSETIDARANCDVVVSRAMDPVIDELGLVALPDNQGFFPAYDHPALVVRRSTYEEFPPVAQHRLNCVADRLTEDTMRDLLSAAHNGSFQREIERFLEEEIMACDEITDYTVIAGQAPGAERQLFNQVFYKLLRDAAVPVALDEAADSAQPPNERLLVGAIDFSWEYSDLAGTATQAITQVVAAPFSDTLVVVARSEVADNLEGRSLSGLAAYLNDHSEIFYRICGPIEYINDRDQPQGLYRLRQHYEISPDQLRPLPGDRTNAYRALIAPSTNSQCDLLIGRDLDWEIAEHQQAMVVLEDDRLFFTHNQGPAFLMARQLYDRLEAEAPEVLEAVRCIGSQLHRDRYLDYSRRVAEENLPLATAADQLVEHYKCSQPELSCTNLIADGDFETGSTAWRLTPTSATSTYASIGFAKLGERVLQLGSQPERFQNVAQAHSTVSQEFAIPAESNSVFLTFYYYAIAQDLTGQNIQFIEVTTETNVRTRWNLPLRPPERWTPFTVDLSHLAGSQITLLFGVTNFPNTSPTAIYIDDVRLEACSFETP